jgi:hypothetical protein
MQSWTTWSALDTLPSADMERPPAQNARDVERETGLEPATPCLEGSWVFIPRESASLGWCETAPEATWLVWTRSLAGGHTSGTRTCDQYSVSSGPSTSPFAKVYPSLPALGSSLAKSAENLIEFHPVLHDGGE